MNATEYTKEAIAKQIAILLNAAFQWTENDQSAVATILTLRRPHIVMLNINGQEFTVTVAELKS